MSLPKLEELCDQSTWNRRYRQMDELSHVSDEARALVVQALTIINKKKDLSYGERKMFDRCSNYKKYLAEKDEADRKGRAMDAQFRREQMRLVKQND